MMSEKGRLIWYNLERGLQDIQIKCEMLDLSIDTLQRYKDSMERSLEIMRHNLKAMFDEYGNTDGKEGNNQQPEQKM